MDHLGSSPAKRRTSKCQLRGADLAEGPSGCPQPVRNIRLSAALIWWKHKEATMANTSGIGSGTSGTTASGSVETDETRDLIASNKVEGTAVYNRQGEHLGTVYNFMVNKR